MNHGLFGELPIREVTIEISAEPVRSTLAAMALLSEDTPPDAGPWLGETAARLSAQDRARNRLVFGPLGPALLADDDHADFDVYLDVLASQSPQALRERVVEAGGGSDVLLEARQTDRDQMQALLDDPPALHDFAVDHLRGLWRRYFAPEWEKSASKVQSMVQMLQVKSWPTPSAGQAIRALIRREVPETISVQLHDVRQIVFVPTPYLALHAARFSDPERIWIFALADFWTLPLREEPIQRSEVLGPLRALSDETRLRLLELLAAQEEMLAQELVAQLEISQPTVSRHLKQLRRAGIIDEQRGEGANKRYRIEHERLEWLHYSLSQVLSAENAQAVLSDARIGLPALLQRFLDRRGLVTDWPAKRNAQREVLGYLIDKFDAEKKYTESEVNDLLNQWHTYTDPAYLRRSLVDEALLKRTENGARYWRA